MIPLPATRFADLLSRRHIVDLAAMSDRARVTDLRQAATIMQALWGEGDYVNVIPGYLC